MTILRKSRIMCVALIIALIATLIAPIGSFTVFAGESGSYGDFNYDYSNEKIIITGYTGSGGDITIPSEIDGYPVVAIEKYAFSACSTLTSVSMPSVTTVGEQAFYVCSNLTSVSMPNVESIGASAFDSCYELATVTMPNVKFIGEEAFDYCYELENVSIPNAVILEAYAFYDCTSLTSMDMLRVEEIGYGAFWGCTALESVSMPNIAMIGDTAFSNCNALTNISVGADNPYYSVWDGILFDKTQTILIFYPASKTNSTYTVPYDVTEIAGGAFSYCANLTSVTMHNVTTIGESAFEGCSNLVTVSMPKAKSIGGYAFYECHSLTSAVMPKVTTIGYGAFCDCWELITVDMPKANDIADDAFYNSNSGLTIYAPSTSYAHVYAEDNSFNFVATDAIYGDYDYYITGGNAVITDYLGSGGDVTIPTTLGGCPVTEIEEGAFYECTTLTSISMPSVITVGREAFYGCESLVSASMPNVETLDTSAFDSCYELTTVTMPNVITIGYEAFDYCYKLKSVDIPLATTIDTYAFFDCNNLESINMPNVISIGDDAFNYCESLTSVSMPSVLTIGEGAFEYCSALERVSMPNVRIIGAEAFRYCEKLNTVIMPDVEEIYYDVFYGCDTDILTIYGYADTFAESYAKDNGYKFALLVTHSVAFCLNGEPVGWQTIEDGQCAEEPYAPAQEGKIFLGWYTKDGVKFDFSTPITEDINLYAKFVDEASEWVKSVSFKISDGKIIFTVITAPGAFNRVKLAADDDRGGYIAYTNTYTVNSDGDYVWTIKAAAPTKTTDYVFDVRSSTTNKYLKEYFEYTAEIITTVKSVSHEVVGDKLVFTVVTGASDYNRVKVSFADDLKGYIAYTNTHTVNSDGDYVWTIKVDIPTSATEYAFDIRSATTGKYLKDYFNYSVDAVVTPTIKSVSHVIANDKIVFTVITKAGNFSRIKVTTADNLGGSLAVASTYTVNSDGDYVWTVKADAPSVVTDYAFDLRSSDTNKYQKEYYNYSVDYIPVVKSISHEFSSGKIIFTVITTPGAYSRIKVAYADNKTGYIAYSNSYTVNSDGNYVWTIKVAAPTETTEYVFDARATATGKYIKDYFYYSV